MASWVKAVCDSCRTSLLLFRKVNGSQRQCQTMAQSPTLCDEWTLFHSTGLISVVFYKFLPTSGGAALTMLENARNFKNAATKTFSSPKTFLLSGWPHMEVKAFPAVDLWHLTSWPLALDHTLNKYGNVCLQYFAKFPESFKQEIKSELPCNDSCSRHASFLCPVSPNCHQMGTEYHVCTTLAKQVQGGWRSQRATFRAWQSSIQS